MMKDWYISKLIETRLEAGCIYWSDKSRKWKFKNCKK